MAEPDSVGTVIDTREILWKARRYRWLALLPVVLALCAAFLYLNIADPVYESSVIISLEDQAPVGEQIERMVRPGARIEEMAQKVARVKNRVLNRTFLQAISDRLGLARDPKLMAISIAGARKYPDITPEEYATRLAVATLSKKVTVTPVGATYIRIGVKDALPQQARRLATAVGEGLIEDTRKSALLHVQARGEFSQDQIAVIQENLRRAEDDYRAYQESVIGQQISTGPVDQANVETVRLLAESADKEADQVRERIGSDRETWSSRMGSVSLPDLRSSRTAELESRLNGLESSYGAASARTASPNATGASQTQSLLQQIGGVRQELLSAYEASAGSLPGDLPDDARLLAAGIALDRAVLRSLQSRKARLQGMVGSYYREARSTPREQLELERRKNAVENLRSQLDVLQREATASRTSEAFETSGLSLRVEVVEAPQVPLKPVWPDRLKVLVGALLLGPLLSVGVILGAERVGALLRTVEQAEEEMGTKVIGTIPRIEGWSRPGSFLENNWAPISILTIILLTALVTGVYTTVTANRHVSTTSGQLRR
jgi:succinoglycan biosynthesis transport protein ExoP